MKTKLKNWIFNRPNNRLLICLIAVIAASNTYAQKSHVKTDSILKDAYAKINEYPTSGEERTIEQQLKVDFRPNVYIESRNAETIIMPSKDEYISVRVVFTANAENESDIELIKKNILDGLIEKSGVDINIKIDFYKVMNSNIGVTKWKTTIKLNDGNKVKIGEFKIKKIIAYIPADLDLKIKNRYSDVKLDFSVQGNLDINTYDCNFIGKAVKGNLNVYGKYSRLTLSSAPKAKLDLYESKFNATEINNIEVNSKYSKIEIAKISEIKLEGYEDKIKLQEIDNGSFTTKYCNIEINKALAMNLNAYEGGINCKKSNTINLNSKYFDVNIGQTNVLNLIDGYENNIDIESVDSLSSRNGKYNDFNIEKLNSRLIVNGYEDDVKINTLSDSFNKISIDGKYQDLKISPSKTAAFKLFGTIQYPDLNLDKNDFQIQVDDKEGALLKYSYFRNNKTTKKEIQANGYEIDVDISFK